MSQQVQAPNPTMRDQTSASTSFQAIKESPLAGLTESDKQALQQRALAYSRVCVIGLGYVGLPTALLFARNGFSVQGVDISPRVLTMFAEDTVADAYPELAPWWHEVRAQSQENVITAAKPTFRASQQPETADVFLITVPTPVHEIDKTCDLSMVRSAMASILPVLAPGNLVVLESTVPSGTTQRVLQSMIEMETTLTVGKNPATDVYLCFSPERVLPGNTMDELVNNDRVIGGVTPQAAWLGHCLLSRVLKGRIDVTDAITAEFCKLAENTYRDVNIALANELSVLADEYGISITQARGIINRHPRVNLLQPGIGVGGHCIAVDPWFFVEASPMNTRLIAISRQVNDRMPFYTMERILKDVADLKNPRIVLAGLAYKPDVADTRESPAMRVVELLREAGMDVVAYDPLLTPATLAEQAQGADYLAILVSHTILRNELNTSRHAIEAVMQTPRIRVF
jgi:UDP-N-acetyl-D-mannosaminuronic acid dehydrogenase